MPRAGVTCPALTATQIEGALGAKPVSIASSMGSPGDFAGSFAINCFYTLGEEPSITLNVWRGAGSLATLEGIISTNEGIFNGEANAKNGVGPDCTPAKSGDCQGKRFDEHPSRYAGLGEKAYDDSGGPSDGANVEFLWKGDTFLVQSSGPYGVPGPALSKVLAFARLIIRSAYSLA